MPLKLHFGRIYYLLEKISPNFIQNVYEDQGSALMTAIQHTSYWIRVCYGKSHILGISTLGLHEELGLINGVAWNIDSSVYACIKEININFSLSWLKVSEAKNVDRLGSITCFKHVKKPNKG